MHEHTVIDLTVPVACKSCDAIATLQHQEGSQLQQTNVTDKVVSESSLSLRFGHLSDKVMWEGGNLLQPHENDVSNFARAPGTGQGVVDLATAKDNSPGLVGRQEVGLP